MSTLGSSLMYIIMAELIFFPFEFGSETEHMLKNLWYVFCTYSSAHFYLTSWCSELTWFIPHVYHNGRTHSFSFEFGSETEHMLKNLWYAFLHMLKEFSTFSSVERNHLLSSSRLI